MLSFDEFLTESTVRMTKDKWQAAYDAIKWTKTSTEFFKNVRDMYGFSTDNQKDYYKASKAFKDIVGAGGTTPVKAPKAAPKAPVTKPAPKASPVQEAPKPKVKFDTSTIAKKYQQLYKLLGEIETETSKVVREYNTLRGGRSMNNLETPYLYNLYLTIEGLKYTQPLRKEIDEKLRLAGRLASDAAKYEKSRK